MNSRLVEACGVLQQMKRYADENKINTVVFGGDLFHTREAVSTDAYNATMEEVCKLVMYRTSYFLVGNHDCFDREGLTHSLEQLKYLKSDYDIHVIDARHKGHVEHYGKRKEPYTLCFVPYTENRKLAVDSIHMAAELETSEPKLLVAHLGMQGAKVGSDYVLVSDGDISLDDIPTDAFAGCLFGHYHQHQQLFKNGWYIGASHQHNWGDVNTKRGFLHVRVYVDHIEFDLIESEAPRFIAIKDTELDTVNIREKDFVKVWTEKRMSDDQVFALRQKAQADSCEVVYVPPDVKLNAVSLDEQHLTPAAMVETWVKANADWLKEHAPNLEGEELVNYGKAILAKVQDE